MQPTSTTTRISLIQSLAIVALTALSMLAMGPGLHAEPPGAQRDGADKQRWGSHGPPREAVAACAQKQAGDACAFQGRRGEQLKGKCWAPPKRALACLPDGHRPPGQSGGEQGRRGGAMVR